MYLHSMECMPAGRRKILYDSSLLNSCKEQKSVDPLFEGGRPPHRPASENLLISTYVCDNAFYITCFLSIATTNQSAIASAKSDNSLQIKTTSHALGVASVIGDFSMVAFYMYGGSILKYILGSNGAIVNGVDMTSHVISSSWDYVKIRGFVAPITIMG